MCLIVCVCRPITLKDKCVGGKEKGAVPNVVSVGYDSLRAATEEAVTAMDRLVTSTVVVKDSLRQVIDAKVRACTVCVRACDSVIVCVSRGPGPLFFGGEGGGGGCVTKPIPWHPKTAGPQHGGHSQQHTARPGHVM